MSLRFTRSVSSPKVSRFTSGDSRSGLLFTFGVAKRAREQSAKRITKGFPSRSASARDALGKVTLFLVPAREGLVVLFSFKEFLPQEPLLGDEKEWLFSPLLVSPTFSPSLDYRQCE